MWKRSIALALWAWGVASFAGPRTAVLAAGDCHDPDLINSMRTFSDALRSRQREEILDEDGFADRLGPPSAKSAEDLKRQLDSAQEEFYDGRNQKARDLIHAANREILRLPPGNSRWALWVFSHSLEGLILKVTNRFAEADELMRFILRLEPTHQLDPDYYAPEYRARFERVRRELGSKQHIKFIVKSTPSNGEVFVDGKSIGRTPLSVELPPASYQILIAREGKVSFPHAVDLHAETSLMVDLGFESSVNSERVPCISDTGDERSQLGKATRLGTMLGVEEVVAIRLDHRTAGPSWLSAAAMNVDGGQKIREGGLKLERPGKIPLGMSDLVNFIITGNAGGSVVAVQSSTFGLDTRPAMQARPTAPPVTATPPPALAPKSGPPAIVVAQTTPKIIPQPAPTPVVVAQPPQKIVPQPAPTPVAVAPAPKAAPIEPLTPRPTVSREPTTIVSTGPSVGPSPAAITLVTIGAAAAATGILFQILSAVNWGTFNALDNNGAGFNQSDLPQAASLRDQARAEQTVAIIGLAAGAVGIGAGLYLWNSGPSPQTATRVSAMLRVSPSSVGLNVTY